MMPQNILTIAAPGGPINFLWMMAAVREDDDRQCGSSTFNLNSAISAPDSTRAAPRKNRKKMTPPNALAMFQHLDWSTIPVESIAVGICGRWCRAIG
jgi:hypothetical protein